MIFLPYEFRLSFSSASCVGVLLEIVCTRRDALRSAAATSGALCAMTSGRSRAVVACR